MDVPPLRLEHLTPELMTVDDVVRIIRSWNGVTADERAQLRAALSMLPIADNWDSRSRPIADRPLRVAEVAEILNVSRQHVRDMIKDGRLRGFRLSSNPRAEYRVLESTVRGLMGGAA